MNQAVVSASYPTYITIPHYHHKNFKTSKSSKVLNASTLHSLFMHSRRPPICCTQTNPWEPAPVTFAHNNKEDETFLKKTDNIFESLNADRTTEVSEVETKELVEASNQPELVHLQIFKWPMWLLGPSLLLTTGMAPTLWLPMSSVFLGPNVASLLSLIGLDCIYNLGAMLFLLMADACARPKEPIKPMSSEAPFSYQFWNILANVVGFMIPLVMFYGSESGLVQPHLPFIPLAVLLGPYILLLSVQILTEMLIWHWRSPVWLVTPIVYEGYRVLQLMRGLKLGAELSAPAWMMHTMRGLVCWWVLILGIQLMRVAWFAGIAASLSHKQEIVTNGS
ncbi:hypothetical protein IC575_022500 [Cucumis melo]|uniref:Uncharacterized protein LOC103482552 n=2 Tax=Cucumis melo TaxID=3656 RepID=A0A1S3ASL3_CUCME|nr:uncharacterized protein LOC103482552 [Cucumis melo]XP_008436989.1 uncharacterized protein LOC103482552 [Cucumis melo]XP_050945750.1 uncharacterized protein LOC103482552 [Cucumis melo]XP_050945751.1 uncharacterized protein LOC103482552 [Cucumis melo]XP_050945752.1 uncharacterized protein LOC103482552 [Cucumis melo]